MQQQADRRPCRNRDKSEVWPPGDDSESQKNQVGITACRHQAEPGVDAPPDMDLETKPPDGDPLDDTLQDIACDDHGEHRHQDIRAEGMGPLLQADPPGQIPEGWVNKVDRVIEDVTELAGFQGDAGQLSVDRVEEGHEPGRQQTGQPRALPEPVEGGNHHDQAERGHLVGCDVPTGAELRDVEGRPWPQPFCDEIRSALVGAHEHAPFGLGLVGCAGQQGIGLLPLAQGLPV